LENFLKDVEIFNSREDLVDEAGRDLYVVIGGDGTLNYFANNFCDDSLQNIIYFPMGTANDFAKNFHLQEVVPSVARVKDCFQSNFYVKLPLMSCNEQLFVNAASIGLPANISEDQDGFIKKLTGPISYHLSAVAELFAHEKAQKVSVNGEEFLSLGMVVSQGLYAGGGARVSPHYTAQFGKTFSLVLHTGENIGPSINAFFSMQSENIEDMPEEIVTVDLENLTIKFEHKQKIKLDGEVYESNAFEFKKSSKTLNFYSVN
jgi:diacylglycerol kinase (ATP)